MKDALPVCYRCQRPARKGLHPFCSKRCAAEDATISLRILALVAKGATVAEALDAVLGAGTYTQIVGDVYDALRKAAP